MNLTSIFDILTIATLVFYLLFILLLMYSFSKKRGIYINDIIWVSGFTILFIMSVIRIILAIELNLSLQVTIACGLSLLYAILCLIPFFRKNKKNKIE